MIYQVTLVTAILSFLNPYTRMGGTELVYNLFAECRSGSANTHSGLCVLDPPTQAIPVIQSIFIALIVKGALTIVTFGIKVPAGIFIPTLGGTSVTGLYRRWIALNGLTQSVHAPDASLAFSFNGRSTPILPVPPSRCVKATSTASSPVCTPWSVPQLRFRVSP